MKVSSLDLKMGWSMPRGIVDLPFEVQVPYHELLFKLPLKFVIWHRDLSNIPWGVSRHIFASKPRSRSKPLEKNNIIDTIQWNHALSEYIQMGVEHMIIDTIKSQVNHQE